MKIINIGPISILLFLMSCMGKKGHYSKLINDVSVENQVLIENINVFNGKDTVLLKNQDVIISEGKIKIPNGGKMDKSKYTVIDGTGKTLLPGFVDAHVHMMSSGAAPWKPIRPNMKHNAEAFLFAGITTVYDLGGIASKTKKVAQKVQNKSINGPDIFFTHAPITIPNAHPLPFMREANPKIIANLFSKFIPQITNRAEADGIVEDYIKKEVDYIKIICDKLPVQSPQMQDSLLKALVISSHKNGLKAIVHIGSEQNAISAVKAGADVLAHCVYKDAISESTAQLIAKSGIKMIYTLSGFDHVKKIKSGEYYPTKLDKEITPKEILDPVTAKNGLDIEKSDILHGLGCTTHEGHPYWQKNVELLRKYNVPFLIGTDSPICGNYPGSSFHQEMELLVEYGYSNFEVLRAATLEGAQMILDTPDFGTIEEGKKANLLIVYGNPLDDISNTKNIRYIIKGNSLIKR